VAYLPAAILFLAFCGWKFTLGLEHVLDLRLGDETKYLSYALGYALPSDPAEWSPLYVDLYRLEHFFVRDPIDLYFFHQRLIAALLPICMFVYFACRRVPTTLALASATYLMISAANLPVEPKTMHLALSIMFLFISIFVCLGEHPARWAVMLAGAALLSLVRPEYAIALIGFVLYAAYLIAATRARDRSLLLHVAIGSILVALLYAHYGFPMYGGRSVFAFAQHFALNYSAWNHWAQDPWSSDYEQIFNSVFPHASSIFGALIANPSAFSHHLLSNLIHSPVMLGGLFFGHFNFILPRFKLYTWAEAILLLAALAAFVVFHRARGSLSFDLSLRPSDGGYRAHASAIFTRILHSLPETICLIIFQLPFVLMMLILYPRNHYVLGFGAILFALAVVLLSRRLHGGGTRANGLIVAAVLAVIVPNLGAVGARVDATMGEWSVVPRPALQTAYFLRGLGIKSMVRVCSAVTPAAGIYAGGNFESVSALDKHQDLAGFLKADGIGIIVEDDRMRQSPAFYKDPAWQIFQTTPGKFGFAAHDLPDSGGTVVFVREDLAPAERRLAIPESSGPPS